MTLTSRDNSLAFNPFLQQLGLDTQTTLYWGDAGHLRWFDDRGRESSIRVSISDVTRWTRRHAPSELWEQWQVLFRDHRILLEHTSVNPVHPLHAGSLRGTIVGSAIAQLLRSAGADVDVRYFVNDRGRQVTFLQRIAGAADWHCMPSHLRADEAMGVLYSLANMLDAHRNADVARLTAQHPWLHDVIDVTAKLPDTKSNVERIVSMMVDWAASDMRALGAEVDSYDHESSLPEDLQPLLLDLAHQFDLTRVNGTWCLRSPRGLVPIRRHDGRSLYFARDVANTRRRLGSGRRILHVIGDDQTLLQRTLQDAVPEADIEHVAVAAVTRGGQKFSARQNRLLTVPEVMRSSGDSGVWGLGLAMLLRRRSVPIDLAALDVVTALDVILRARRHATRVTEGDSRRDTGGTDWWNLTRAMVQAPGVLHRAVTTRAPHASAGLLLELSQRYLRAARHQDVSGWQREWFLDTQNRIARAHGLHLDLDLDLDLDATYATFVPQDRRSA